MKSIAQKISLNKLFLFPEIDDIKSKTSQYNGLQENTIPFSKEIPLDVWKIIFNYLDFRSRINIILACFYFRNNLFIINLYHIDPKYLTILSTTILKYPIFRYVTEL